MVMYTIRELRKYGNSFVFAIPKSIIESSELKLGDKVKISSDREVILIEKYKGDVDGK